MKGLRWIGAVALAATGLAAGVMLGFPPSASAWNWQSLPDGYSVSSYQTVCHTSTDPCKDGDGSTCNHVTITANGIATFTETDCVNPNFGAHVDDYVNSTICSVNPAAGQSQGLCLPTTTAAPDPPTTTDIVPPPAAPVTTTAAVETVTVTDTVTVSDPSLEQRIQDLEAEYAALAARVDAIQQANDASWTAFIDALNAGATVADAALAARSAGLNAIYELA